MDVVIIITEYQHHLESVGYAESTIKAYRRNLDLFKDHLKGSNIMDLRNVTSNTILEYQAQIMSEPIARESKALKIRPVKRLFEYLTVSNRLLINPTEGIVETSRKNMKLGYVLDQEEVIRILNQPNLSKALGIRDRAILEVMYSTGIRVNELVNLEIYHADLKENVVYVRKGKGGKQRVVPLGNRAAKYLKDYLVEIRPKHARKHQKEQKLFLTHSGNPLAYGTVQAFTRKYRLTAGIQKPVSPHAFRRACATHMLRQGADIRYIQKLLGHSRLSTTQIYTRILPEEIKLTHETTHPNNKENES